jgi:hypothetical protein
MIQHVHLKVLRFDTRIIDRIIFTSMADITIFANSDLENKRLA